MYSFSEKTLQLVYIALIAASILCIMGNVGHVTVNESHSIENNRILSTIRGLEEKTSLLRGRKLQYLAPLDPSLTYHYSQLGDDIDGDNTADFAGSAVAMR